jgi:hypothetical protein
MESKSHVERTWRQERLDLSLVVLFSGCLFLYAHLPAFTSPYVINDDVRQQIFWMQQWQYPGLYLGDWLSDYARHYVPWGVQAIYRIASPVVAPLYFSRLLPGFLFVSLTLCLFLIGKLLGGRRLAWITAAVFSLMPFFMDNLAGGLSRSFAAPLLALFLYCQLTHRTRGVGLTLLLQALFIPYIFLLCATAALLAYGGSLIGLDHGRGPRLPEKPGHFLPLLVGGALVALWYWSLNAAGYGPLVSYQEMLGRPEFTAEGRYEVLPVPSVFWELIGDPLRFIGYFRNGVIRIVAGAATCVVLAGSAIHGARRSNWSSFRTHLRPFLYTAAASFLLYAVARIFLLRLFIPSRYLTYTVNLSYCITIAICIHGAFQQRTLNRKLLISIVLLVLVLAGIRLRGVGLYDYSADRALYAALENTPEDALVAGHPALMDNVLTFARRRVLVSFELSHPWCVGSWTRMQPRLRDFFTAYYSDQPGGVLAFANKYNVDFLVVDDRHFQPAFLDDHPFFAPFDEMIRTLVKGRERFALLSKDVFPSMPVNDHQRLLDLRPFRHEARSLITEAELNLDELQIDSFFDDIEGPAFDLVTDSADVFSDKSQCHKLNAAKEKDHYH